MYAYDTSLCYQTLDISNLNNAISNNPMQLDTWLKGSKLSLNVAKTNCMLIATKQKHSYLKYRNDDLHLIMCNKELEVIQKTRYFGIVIYNSLKCKEHIKNFSAKVSIAIGFLRHEHSYHRKHSRPYTLVLWSHTFDIVALLLFWFNRDLPVRKTETQCC